MTLVIQGLAQTPKRPQPSSLSFRTPGPRNFQQTTPSWSHPETLPSAHTPSTQPEHGWDAQREAGFASVLPNFNAAPLVGDIFPPGFCPEIEQKKALTWLVSVSEFLAGTRRSG